MANSGATEATHFFFGEDGETTVAAAAGRRQSTVPVPFLPAATARDADEAADQVTEGYANDPLSKGAAASAAARRRSTSVPPSDQGHYRSLTSIAARQQALDGMDLEAATAAHAADLEAATAQAKERQRVGLERQAAHYRTPGVDSTPGVYWDKTGRYCWPPGSRIPGNCGYSGAWVARKKDPHKAQDNGYAERGHFDHRGNYTRDVGPRN
jgi:hypothetical protein